MDWLGINENAFGRILTIVTIGIYNYHKSCSLDHLKSMSCEIQNARKN